MKESVFYPACVCAKARNKRATLPHALARVPFYVYILASNSRTLYIGVTNNLEARLEEHRAKHPGSFTARYSINRLVHVEHFQYINNAIRRKKELKDWNRAKKVALIETENPTWEDLSEVWWKADPFAALRDDKRKSE